MSYQKKLSWTNLASALCKSLVGSLAAKAIVVTQFFAQQVHGTRWTWWQRFAALVARMMFQYCHHTELAMLLRIQSMVEVVICRCDGLVIFDGT